MKTKLNIIIYFDSLLGFRREIARGVLQYVREHSHIQLMDISYQPIVLWNEMSIKDIAALKTDGIILPIYNEATDRQITKFSIPAVSLSSAYPECTFPVIAPDRDKSMKLATQCFLDEGIKHLILVGPPGDAVNIMEHVAKTTSRSYDISIETIALKFQAYGARRTSYYINQFADSALKYFNKYTDLSAPSIGVIAHNDAYAFAVASTVKSIGMKIPEDVSIIGHDDNDLICESSVPTLSSIIPDGIKQGYLAAKTLDLCMQRKHISNKKIFVPPLGIHHRESSPMLATGNPHVDQSIRFIRLNACNGIGVMDVVQQVPLSRRSLELHFNTFCGHSPYREIIKVRIDTACQILENTNFTNMHVALQTGFQSAERFQAAFKSAMGITPGQYRHNSTII